MERLDGRFAVRFVYEDLTFWERSAGVSQQHMFAVLGQNALVIYISNSQVNVKRKIAERSAFQLENAVWDAGKFRFKNQLLLGYQIWKLV